MAGRPRLEGNHVTATTFKLRPELLQVVTSGAYALSQHLTREHSKNRPHSPNNALWLRSLISFAFDNRSCVSHEAQKASIAAVTARVDKPILLSLKYSEEISVKLRKIECSVQALDWTVDFNSGATLNFIVMVYGEHFNRSLE